MSTTDITLALARAERDEPGAAEQLWELVYADLRRLAAARLAQLAPGQTMQATALVHEFWLRLDDGNRHGWQSRAHFFGAAARSMRNIMIDQARRKQRLRRGADRERELLAADLVADPDSGVGAGADAVDVLALDEALTALAAEYERPARVMQLRYFAGLTIEAIAELENVTPRTIDRDFLFARTWLLRRLDRG